MDRAQTLARKKRHALILLLTAVVLFLCMTFLPPTFWWVRLLKGGAEAAMVGGLADWFAVVALFRKPLGLPIPHTAIIAENKARIADSLANFVKDKFLAPAVLSDLIRRANPSLLAAEWLAKPANAQRIAGYMAGLIGHGLTLLGDQRIRAFIDDAARVAAGKVNLSPALGSIFSLLTQGGRHQELLDTVLAQVQTWVAEPDVRDEVVGRVAGWFKEKYPKLSTLVPEGAITWVGGQTADAMQTGLSDFLQELADSPTHELRGKVDEAMVKLIGLLQKDEAFIHKGEEIKDAFLNNPVFHDYITGLWDDLRDWLNHDLQSPRSRTLKNFETIGLWVGERFMQDDALRDSLDEHMQVMVGEFAPDFSDFLTRHIRETVQKWDPRELTKEVELSIGPDLQFIRMSGTVVGFLIGLMIFGVSELIRALV